eukprot:TRINITY_DN616_c0_g1_i2.p1 TRINITY_DN616_c0_g1~~TRINITY_DN616_c0_g1_i2.p1  ORF type:complete len:284 (-),score=48.67 TRINITY_DN616_c0_g1_i2:105-956(-)
MASRECTKRLMREYQQMEKSSPPCIIARPNQANILEWHYVLMGPKDTVYEGGVYHGILKFPASFPHKPPSILMCTPNGRFATNSKLCLSISDFHPETWNPMWTISAILTGLLSFMLEDKQTHGSIVTTDSDKRQLAAYSITYNYEKNLAFKKHFPELLSRKTLEEVRLKSIQPLQKTTTTTAATSTNSATTATTATTATSATSATSTNSVNSVNSVNTATTATPATTATTATTATPATTATTGPAKREGERKKEVAAAKEDKSVMWFSLIFLLVLAAGLNTIL